MEINLITLLVIILVVVVRVIIRAGDCCIVQLWTSDTKDDDAEPPAGN